MEALKIAVTCVIAAVLYGIVHDQFTARICIEYFTIFHPPIFHTQSPTLLGIGWGIVATWWVGVFFAVPMILAARAGSRPTLRASELLPSIESLLAFMAASAVLFGLTGYVLARKGVLATDWLSFASVLQTAGILTSSQRNLTLLVRSVFFANVSALAFASSRLSAEPD